jgi:proteasome lid subunit RPN8/RPN11
MGANGIFRLVSGRRFLALLWPKSIFQELKAWSEKCYPYEGCGVLLGQWFPRQVLRFVPLSNLLREGQTVSTASVLETASQTLGQRVHSQGQYEFVMDPAEFNQAVLAGEKEGLDVVGVVHTHPDHPAQPSVTDAAQPLLAGWSNIIVRVDLGHFVEARSWIRDEESSPFEEEPLTVKEE